MPRRSIQDNIRIKQERDAAASRANLIAQQAGLPPPAPVAAPAPKRKRGRPSKADLAAEAYAQALAGVAVPVPSLAEVAAGFAAQRAPLPHYHPGQASGSHGAGINPAYAASAAAQAYAAPHTHSVPPTQPAYSAYAAPSYAAQADIKPLIPASQPIYQAQGSSSAYAAPYVEVPAEKPKKKRKTAAEKAAEPTVEKRPARVRVKAPQSTMERMSRVMSQRMFMVDRERIRDGDMPAERFAVLGSTGNVYRVTIDFNPTCDCPDCLKGNVPCKHIIFVFLKVLKLPTSSTIWYQKGLTNSELKHVFEQAPPSPNDPAHVSAAVRTAYLKATGKIAQDEEVPEESAADAGQGKKREVVGEDCPVCYEEMSEADVKSSRLVFDESAGGCGNALHRECFNMWANTARSKGEAVTCVYCRAEWDQGGKGKGKAAAAGPSYSGMGYLNMADVAGVSRQRDTTSYYHGPVRGMHMWELGKRYQND